MGLPLDKKHSWKRTSLYKPKKSTWYYRNGLCKMARLWCAHSQVQIKRGTEKQMVEFRNFSRGFAYGWKGISLAYRNKNRCNIHSRFSHFSFHRVTIKVELHVQSVERILSEDQNILHNVTITVQGPSRMTLVLSPSNRDTSFEMWGFEDVHLQIPFEAVHENERPYQFIQFIQGVNPR